MLTVAAILGKWERTHSVLVVLAVIIFVAAVASFVVGLILVRRGKITDSTWEWMLGISWLLVIVFGGAAKITQPDDRIPWDEDPAGLAEKEREESEPLRGR